jgi:hypothetical protein
MASWKEVIGGLHSHLTVLSSLVQASAQQIRHSEGPQGIHSQNSGNKYLVLKSLGHSLGNFDPKRRSASEHFFLKAGGVLHCLNASILATIILVQHQQKRGPRAAKETSSL